MQPNERHEAWGGDEPASHNEGDVQSSFNSRYDGYGLSGPDVFPEQQVVGGEQLIEWEASEYIHHEKDGAWFALLAIGALIGVGLALVFRQWTFAVLIIVLAAAIAVFARRPPRTLHYALDTTGVRIDDRLFPYTDFRAFGVVSDGPLYSVVLLPTKRFLPATSMYFEPQDGEKIVDILGARLPLEQIKVDFVDRLTRKLRF